MEGRIGDSSCFFGNGREHRVLDQLLLHTLRNRGLSLLNIAAAGLLSVGRNWMNPIAPFVAGFIGNRFWIAMSAVVLLLIMMVSIALFSITPAKASSLPLVQFNVALAALSFYALRGIYFALLDEQGVPKSVTSTAAGAVSVIGFTPDICMPALSGAILDSFPGLPGYRILFGGAGVVGALGCMAAWTLCRTRKFSG
jgi:MFS family permease